MTRHYLIQYCLLIGRKSFFSLKNNTVFYIFISNLNIWNTKFGDVFKASYHQNISKYSNSMVSHPNDDIHLKLDIRWTGNKTREFANTKIISRRWRGSLQKLFDTEQGVKRLKYYLTNCFNKNNVYYTLSKLSSLVKFLRHISYLYLISQHFIKPQSYLILWNGYFYRSRARYLVARSNINALRASLKLCTMGQELTINNEMM